MVEKIRNLKITAEDEWLKEYIKTHGNGVKESPHYQYLIGNYKPMFEWMSFRKLPISYITDPLMFVLKSVMKNGQMSPIKIYKDRRINTGHKRASCMMYLGYDNVNVEIVSDNYKL